jgi:predicted permease
MSGSFRQAFQRVRAFLQKQQMERDLSVEFASHLDFAIEENLRLGMSADEARRQALIRFGGMERAKEQHRETCGLPAMDILFQDLRYTLRTLRRDRAFTIIGVLILGLGIGANIAVFSVVNNLLLRPLPFHDPQQLVWIADAAGKSGLSSITYSADAYEQFRRQNRSFQDVTGYFAFSTSDNFQLRGNGNPLPVTGINVTGNFFRTLGVKPRLGRLFSAEECVKNGRPAVLLEYGFWQRQFGGDAGIVGRAINLNSQPVTVIGVLPDSFDFGSVFLPGAKVNVFVPAILDDMRDWGNTLALIGRLKPDVSLPQAQAEANTLAPTLYFNVKYSDSKGQYTAKLTGLKEYVSGKLRRSLIVLWCAVGLILLIVCVNLSNLLLARVAARSKEFAMRAALGAGRGRLVSQLLTESFVLSGAGAILGLAFAYATVFYLAHQGSIALPLLSTVRVDAAALGWTLFIAAGSALVFGLSPGLKMSGKDLQASLKDMGHGMSAGRKHQRLRAALVISEVALACVLLVGAGLLLRSFLQVLDVDLGFQPSRASAIKVDYDDGNNAKRAAILQEMLRRVQSIPGIETAGISDNLPLEGNRSWGLSAKGKQYRKGELKGAFVYMVTPGYLRAMGMRLREGRDFSWHDGANSQPVVIVNETAARSLWRGEDPVGRMALVNGKDTRVVGVVSDVHESSVEGEAGWQMYLPESQAGPMGAELVVRSSLPPGQLAPSIMRSLRSLNPAQPETQLRPIQASVDHAVSPRRFFVLLVSIFASLGLILAGLGIYGVISYSVTQQTQEIGIRMALGATVGQVQFGVIRETLRLVAVGVTAGTLASLAVAGLIASLLFKTASTDPAAFIGTVLVLGIAAFLAGYVPSRRATRVDPMIALRSM